jgi:hypothetical protein
MLIHVTKIHLEMLTNWRQLMACAACLPAVSVFDRAAQEIAKVGVSGALGVRMTCWWDTLTPNMYTPHMPKGSLKAEAYGDHQGGLGTRSYNDG